MSWVSKSLDLEARFAGASDPRAMGTSGLLAWTILGGPSSKAWHRYRRARSVIEGRGLPFGRFRAQLLREASAYNKALGERLGSYR